MYKRSYNHGKTTSIIGLTSLEEEGMLIFKDKDAIKRLQEENYDFALVDLPHSMLLSHKLSLPFAIFGLDAPHLIRRIPYVPRSVPLLDFVTTCLVDRQIVS